VKFAAGLTGPRGGRILAGFEIAGGRNAQAAPSPCSTGDFFGRPKQRLAKPTMVPSVLAFDRRLGITLQLIVSRIIAAEESFASWLHAR
jgi:hypothetical protein